MNLLDSIVTLVDAKHVMARLDDAVRRIKLDDPESLGIADMIREGRCAVAQRGKSLQRLGESVAKEAIVAEDQGDVVAGHEMGAAVERIGELILDADIPTLLVPGVAAAVRQAGAPRIYICHVMTQPETRRHQSTLGATLAGVVDRWRGGATETPMTAAEAMRPATPAARVRLSLMSM